MKRFRRRAVLQAVSVLFIVTSSSVAHAMDCNGLLLPTQIHHHVPISGWTAQALARLAPLAGSEAEALATQIGWPWRTPEQLAELAAKFQHVRASGRFGLELEVGNDSGDAFGYVAHPNLQLVGVLTDRETGKPSASLELNFYKNRSGELEVELRGVYSDRDNAALAGLGRSLLQFLRENVFTRLPVVRMRGIADYTGRYVWVSLIEGAKLSLTDWNSTAWVYTSADGGRDSWRAVLENFSRFLQFHKIPVSEIYIPQLNGAPEKRPRSMSDFSDVREILQARSRISQKLPVQPLLRIDSSDTAILGPLAEYEVGKAFALMSYVPIEDRPTIQSHWGQEFNDLAMPPYSFVVELGAP